MMVSVTTVLHLVKEFFQIGLFSFGGGYATLPFLYNLTHYYNWFTPQDLSQMIAVATITPGPVAINVATYAGMKAGGILTALIATSSEVMPELIVGLIVAKLLKKFSENFYVQSALWALKPTGCALLTYVAIKLFTQNIVHNSNLLFAGMFFVVLLLISIFKPKDPLWYIAVASVVGVAFIKIGLI